MAWLFRTDPLVKEYQRYREAARALNSKIINACLNETILERAARMLRLGQKRLLFLDSEDDLSVLMDFVLYEIQQGDGKNVVKRYAEENGGANAIEGELLAAMVKAQTGLYKVSQILREKRQLVLDNLIIPEASLILTDIGFSLTLADELIIFFRPIRMTKFTMTSGVAFVFPAELQRELTKRWKLLDSKGDAERFAWFFRKSKQSGFEVIYV